MAEIIGGNSLEDTKYNIENHDTQENLKSGDILSSTDNIDIQLLDEAIMFQGVESKNELNKDFIKLLNSIENKNDFINLLENLTSKQINEFVEEYGYPNFSNLIKLENYGNLVKIRLKEKSDIKEKKLDKKNEFNDIFKGLELSKSGLPNNIHLLITEIVSLDSGYEEKLDILFNELEKDSNLEKLLTFIAKNGDEFQLNNFVSFVENNTKNAKLITKISEFKIKNSNLFAISSEELAVSMTDSINTLSFMSVPNTVKDGDKFVTSLDEDTKAVTDTSTRPPKRIVTNGKFDLDSKPYLGPNLKVTLDYEESVGLKNEHIKEKVNTGNTIYGEIQEIDTKISDINLQLEEVKKEMGEDSLLYKELLKDKIELESTKIQKEINLENVRAEISKEKEKLELIKANYLKEVINNQKAHQEILQNEDNVKKNVLKFLSSIGLDIVDQDITKQLIKEYKSNIFDIKGFKLRTGTIDLECGRFGEDPSEFGKGKLGNQARNNLVLFMEKMIYGEIGSKKSIFFGIDSSKEFTIDPNNVNKALIDNKIKVGSSWGKNTMRENLKK